MYCGTNNRERLFRFVNITTYGIVYFILKKKKSFLSFIFTTTLRKKFSKNYHTSSKATTDCKNLKNYHPLQ